MIYIHEVRQTVHRSGRGTVTRTHARISNKPFDHKMRRWRAFDTYSWCRLLDNPAVRYLDPKTRVYGRPHVDL